MPTEREDRRASRGGIADEVMGEVLFEITALGGALRVAAIDPRRNVEVVICGPAGHGTDALKRLAIRKLALRLQRDGAARQR